MSAEATTWVIAVALTCFAVTSIGGLVLQGVLHSHTDSVHRVVSSRPTSRVCDAPPCRFTVDAAHRAMQLHSAPRGAVIHIGGEMTPK